MCAATVVDADAHINEDATTWQHLDEQYPGRHRAGTSGGKQVHLMEGKLYPTQEGPGCGVPVDSALMSGVSRGDSSDLEDRVGMLDTEGIDVQVLFGGLAIAVTSLDDPAFAADFAIAYNDWLLRDVSGRHPDRLRGVAVLPLQDVGRAIDEMKRSVANGAVAVMIPPVVGDRNLDDLAFLPFFAEAAAIGVPVAVHSAPGMNLPLPAAGRFSNYAQVHSLSFPVDQMVAFTALAMGGVLDRYPELRVAFLESGIGWVPYFVHRVREHREGRPELLGQMTSMPEAYFSRGQCFFSFEGDEPCLAAYIEQLGAGSLLYASDYPHWDAEPAGSLAKLRASLDRFGTDVQDALLGGNAAKLYGIADSR
jgi:predicted TIM-barrel fold metal-dependent hydrolase